MLQSRTLVQGGHGGAGSLSAHHSGVPLPKLKSELFLTHGRLFFPAFIGSLHTLLRVCCRLRLVSFFLRSWPPSLTSLRSSPCVLLYSSPPSFKCQWAVEQYPGGHGDRRPPPCGLFLLLSLVLLLLGSCTRATHTRWPKPHSAWLKFMHQSRGPWEICIEELK